MNNKQVSQFAIILLLFLGFFSQKLLAQTEKKLASTITHVTVFRSQAQVERNAKVSLDEGYYTLVFEGISPNLIANSIEAEALSGITILSISTQNDYLKVDQKPKLIMEMEDSIERLNEHLSAIKADKESIALQKDVLIANKYVGGTAQGVKADELEDVLAIYQKKLIEFKHEMITLHKLEKEYTGILQKLQLQLEEYNQGTLNLNNQILVNVKVERAVSNVEVKINYLANGVSWQPFYDIRVKDTKSPVQFLLKANIQQNTGESWKNVTLKLTTANPLEGGSKPQLTTNFINFVEPEIKKQEAQRRNKSMQPATMNFDAASSMAEFVSVSQNMINTVFEINTPYTIPSDNKFHQVDLTTFSQAAIYAHAAVPKIVPGVFVTAQVLANDLINQIEAEANVYFEGTYTGKTMISASGTDTLLLTLGVDKRITTERIKVKEMSAKSFFGTTKKESSAYEISVKNSTNEAIDLIIEDQVPMSANKEIEIKTNVSDGGSVNKETGLIKWNLKLQPQQSIKLRFSFEVISPSDKKISAY
ncbi:MAG: DUF4139 domain-containing protein [Bacteroidia bacterium]|nr:DUF4139 domain-containing protein [Bacteroidia bacterium]